MYIEMYRKSLKYSLLALVLFAYLNCVVFVVAVVVVA